MCVLWYVHPSEYSTCILSDLEYTLYHSLSCNSLYIQVCVTVCLPAAGCLTVGADQVSLVSTSLRPRAL